MTKASNLSQWLIKDANLYSKDHEFESQPFWFKPVIYVQLKLAYLFAGYGHKVSYPCQPKYGKGRSPSQDGWGYKLVTTRSWFWISIFLQPKLIYLFMVIYWLESQGGFTPAYHQVVAVDFPCFHTEKIKIKNKKTKGTEAHTWLVSSSGVDNMWYEHPSSIEHCCCIFVLCSPQV